MGPPVFAQTPAIPPGYQDVLLTIGKFLLGFLAVYLVGKYLAVPAVSRIVRSRNRNNPTLHQTIGRYVWVVIIAIAVVAALAAAGYSAWLTSSAIVLAAMTLAIGVAGQQVVGAIISGLFLVADPYFNVGDWISWDGHEGVVESITLRTTRIRTVRNEVITVPNTELTANAIVRPYGREQFRITEHVNVSYDDDVDEAMRHLREAASADRAVLLDPAPVAYLVAFGDDAVRLMVQYWLAADTRRNILSIRSNFARRLKRRFEQSGITLSPAAKRELFGELSVEQQAEGRVSDAEEGLAR
ncbi:mechanosensitive ion channel family protein [Haloarchaeobius sp. DT45]|uniref:mechanosensitive ion channel family protein n=1 Tax=Haloarchaeobius sp. DT45 TaxID=3446116 RepID=UPI003F6D87DA